MELKSENIRQKKKYSKYIIRFPLQIPFVFFDTSLKKITIYAIFTTSLQSLLINTIVWQIIEYLGSILRRFLIFVKVQNFEKDLKKNVVFFVANSV